MNAINTIRQWCSGKGYAFSYGNPTHVNWWMGNTDFSASANGTAVFCHLLTASEYDGSKDSYNVGIYFATLCDFDFDNESIDTTTEALKERAKALLTDLSQGNAVGWSGARFTYGYDDYAENVVWCCLRVTLTALAAECVEMPDLYNVQLLDASVGVEYFATGENITEWCGRFVTGTQGNLTHFVSLNIITDIAVQVDSSMFNIDHTVDKAVQCFLVDNNAIAVAPSLSAYKGKYICIFYAILNGHHTQTVTISVPVLDVNLSCEITY